MFRTTQWGLRSSRFLEIATIATAQVKLKVQSAGCGQGEINENLLLCERVYSLFAAQVSVGG